jgi:arylsulfatase A-like enzyme
MKILVIEARGLPTGFLGCYGNEWVGTPCLDRLAAEGIVFDSHIAAVPDISATERTWSGEPVRLETLTYARIDAVSAFAAAALTAWRRVPDGGILWIDGPNLAPPWSLPRDLLDSYCEPPEEPWPDPPRGVWPKVEIGELLRLHNTFAAVVTYFDAQLDALLEDMDEPDDALICVTARCGLPLGEHGLVGAGRAWLHDELVHVPLVMRLPGGRDAGRRIAALTQPADLPPTFRQLLSAGQAATSATNRGLLPLLNGEAETIRPHARSALTVGDSAELALRTPDWALLVPTKVPAGDLPRGPQLYVKPDDRWEVNDVRQQHLELTEELEAILAGPAL